MITFADNKTNAVSFIGIYTKEEVDEKFTSMIPAITVAVKCAFRDYDPEKREDALQCVLTQSYMNVRSLAEMGRLHDAYPTPISRFAISAYKTGRPGGFEQNSTDVLGEATRFKRRVDVESLEQYNDRKRSWDECFVTDGRVNVANEVCFKMDLEAWIKTLDWKRREMLERMIQGDTTNELAKQFQCSAGRISQIRRELVSDWREFRGTYDKKHQYDDFLDQLIRLAEEDERAGK